MNDSNNDDDPCSACHRHMDLCDCPTEYGYGKYLADEELYSPPFTPESLKEFEKSGFVRKNRK